MAKSEIGRIIDLFRSGNRVVRALGDFGFGIDVAPTVYRLHLNLGILILQPVLVHMVALISCSTRAIAQS